MAISPPGAVLEKQQLLQNEKYKTIEINKFNDIPVKLLHDLPVVAGGLYSSTGGT
jgi:hypothetical protein